MLTLLEISDASGKPQVKMDLPQVNHGSRVRLRFRLQRENNGRQEILLVEGQYRVVAVGTDASVMPQRQVVSVEAIGVTPSWRAVKKMAPWRRTYPPAKAPRKVIAG